MSEGSRAIARCVMQARERATRGAAKKKKKRRGRKEESRQDAGRKATRVHVCLSDSPPVGLSLRTSCSRPGQLLQGLSDTCRLSVAAATVALSCPRGRAPGTFRHLQALRTSAGNEGTSKATAEK